MTSRGRSAPPSLASGRTTAVGSIATEPYGHPARPSPWTPTSGKNGGSWVEGGRTPMLPKAASTYSMVPNESLHAVPVQTPTDYDPWDSDDRSLGSSPAASRQASKHRRRKRRSALTGQKPKAKPKLLPPPPAEGDEGGGKERDGACCCVVS